MSRWTTCCCILYFGPCREHGPKSKAKVIVKCQTHSQSQSCRVRKVWKLGYSSQPTPRGNVRVAAEWTHRAAPQNRKTPPVSRHKPAGPPQLDGPQMKSHSQALSIDLSWFDTTSGSFWGVGAAVALGWEKLARHTINLGKCSDRDKEINSKHEGQELQHQQFSSGRKITMLENCENSLQKFLVKGFYQIIKYYTPYFVGIKYQNI